VAFALKIDQSMLFQRVQLSVVRANMGPDKKLKSIKH